MTGAAMALAAVLCILRYRAVAQKQFGGIRATRRMVFAKGGAVDAGAGSVQPAFGGDGMIFITGPLYSGNGSMPGCCWAAPGELAQRAVGDVQELAAGCGDLAARSSLPGTRWSSPPRWAAASCRWTKRARRAGGGGPSRLPAGAARDAVVRVFCGIPVYLKGAPNT